MIDGATAVGYLRRTLLWMVELPLAVPMLVPGVRVAAVSTVGLVTIGVPVEIPSAGMLLTDGFQRRITAGAVTGVAVTVALALAVDGLAVLPGRLLTPWTRVSKAPGAEEEQA